MNRKLRVLLVSGFWGQNIGNAFFNLGGMYILKNVFPHEEVTFIHDHPQWWIFNKRKLPRNALNLLKYVNADILVLQGPLLCRQGLKVLAEIIDICHQRNIKLVLLSVGMYEYTEEEKTMVKNFLSKNKIPLVSTRDEITYRVVKDVCEIAYNGIDSAFFVNDCYRPALLEFEYIVVNFDHSIEPNISVSNVENGEKADIAFFFDNYYWYLRYPKFKNFVDKIKVGKQYVAALIDRRKLPDRIGKYLIIRTRHQTTPFFKWKIYNHPNVIAFDEPFSYLTTYANAKLTITCRVHACVASLAYGNYAVLLSQTPRAYLLDRLGLHNIKKVPCKLDNKYLLKEKQELLSFLQNTLPHII